LAYFMAVWYIIPRFGMLYQVKSGNPALFRNLACIELSLLTYMANKVKEFSAPLFFYIYGPPKFPRLVPPSGQAFKIGPCPRQCLVDLRAQRVVLKS
jgi:hypothetical protein